MQKNLLEKSESEIIRLENLINNILAATRLENAERVLESEKFNFSELIEKELNLIKANFGENHSISSNIEKDIMFEGDSSLILLILSNLMENAIKYSPKNTEINVEVVKRNWKIELSVKDQGIGIEKKDQDKMFEKFYRSGNENVRQHKGTGLGLYLVKNLVAEYGGTITVLSEKNEGTEIKISIWDG